MEGFVVGLASEIAKAALTSAAKKIHQEASLILGFEGSFRELHERLDDLHLHLRDIDGNRDRQQSKLLVKKLLGELESAALEAQDVIDLCVVKGLVSSASSSHPSHRHSRFNIYLRRCFGNVQSMPGTYRIGVQIRNMNTILDKIEERVRSVTTLSALGASTTSSSSNREHLLRRAEVIYREDTAVNVIPKRQHVEALINQYRVVAIVGMGGSGKTHLLQHVFKSIKSRYEVAIWLSVSRTFTVKQLQLNVLAKLREQLLLEAFEVGRFEPQGESEDILQGKIDDALKNRKYLIVFDDVWELQGNELSYCQDIMEKLRLVGLPENDLRTVLVSTRNHEVASQIGAHAYKIPLLSEEHSRDLLFKHLLPHSQVEQLQVDCNVEAEAAIETALKRCGGLPLAIITVAGLLKHQNPDEWAKSVQYLPSSSSSADLQQNVVTTALMLSFSDLDYSIKPCFVMLGLFAEDEKIDAENLIGMWFAEGHVRSHKEGILMLKHLCNRCLLEMKKPKKESLNSVINIHDLVHDLAVKLCTKYGGICEVSHYREEVLQQGLLSRKERISRISLSKAGISCIPNTVAFPRSLHVLRLDQNENLSEIPSKSLAPAVALRTLDIRGTRIASLPECIRNFLLLKYLDIRDSQIRRLPECLRNLKLLEYLYTSIRHDVPQWIGNLEQLAFFEAESARWTKIDRIPRYLKRVRGLRIETGSDGNNNNDEGDKRSRRRRLWIGDSLSELTQLEYLDGLYIDGFKEGCMPPPNIVWLTLYRKHGKRVLTIPNEWQSCLQTLQDLIMTGIQFPDELHGFQKISVLRLYHSHLYPKVISDLPWLQTLDLSSDDTCVSLPEEYGRPGAFPKLRALLIFDFQRLKKMPKIEHGGMPCLSELELTVCPKLSEGCGWTQKVATLSSLRLQAINLVFKAELETAYNSVKVTEQSSSIREDRGGQ